MEAAPHKLGTTTGASMLKQNLYLQDGAKSGPSESLLKEAMASPVLNPLPYAMVLDEVTP